MRLVKVDFSVTPHFTVKCVVKQLIIGVLGTVFSPLYAFDLTTQDLGIELQQQQQRELLERKLATPIPSLPNTQSIAPTSELQCVAVKAINLMGISLLTATEQQSLITNYLNRCLTKSDINQLLQTINQAYIAKGYITTRAYLPEQNVALGQLKLEVIEGKIENIQLNNNQLNHQRASDKRRVKYAFPVNSQDYLRLSDIEQGLDQINRAPSAQGQIALEPSTEVGYTRILIHTVDEKTWRGRIGLDNYGEKTIGRTRLQLAFDRDNLLELNDVWSIAAVRTEDSRALSLTSSIPYRYWTILLSYSASAYDVPITTAIRLAGQGRSSVVGVERLIHRNQSQQWSWTAQIASKESERDINGIALTPDNLSTLRLGGRWLYRHSDQQAYVDWAWAKGLTALGATHDNSVQLSSSPHHQFNKFEVTASLRQSLKPNWTWLSQAKAQYSSVGLTASEQLNVGGSDTIRGFSTAVANGDQGFYWRNHIQRSCLSEWLAHSSCLVFMDVGIVKSLAAPPIHTLLGSGLGIQYDHHYWSASAQLGAPLYADDALPTDNVVLSLKASLNY